ncbi:MAG: hypothetical protein SF051_14725 [Elusimicrobiota bacterium]|nr:hypothetical protein [Elusimicrobiota bacterium]
MRSRWLAVLLLAACGPTKETEPNDAFQQATFLKAGAKAVGTIASPGDQDWYRIDSAGDTAFSARIGGIREVDFVLTLLDKDRVPLKKVDETVAGGDEALLDASLRPGAYYLVVGNKNEKAANAGQEYELSTKNEPAAGREREPNDKALQATPIEPSGTARGHHWPTKDLLSEDPEAGEEDWYSVEVSREGLFLLNADVSEVRNVDPILEVYDASGYKLKDLDAGGVGEGESLRSFGVRGPGRFLLRLRGKHKGAGNAELPYDLMTELLPYQGRVEFEPNDQLADATPVNLDSIQGAISPAGDADWYKVAVDSGAKTLLRVELSGLPGADLVLSLKDPVGGDLLVVDNMGKEQPEVLTGWGSTGGEVVFSVTEKSGRKADARQPYTLTRKLIPAQDGLEWEPNNSTAAVQALKAGESVDGYFAPKGDEDWYEFNLYQKGAVSLELTGVFLVTPTLTLFDQEYAELGSAAATRPGEPVTFARELEPGTYAVRLKPADPGQANTRDKYSLRVRVR